jgi:succinate dehydrogenase/fumarate reductase-like Fe-S protein
METLELQLAAAFVVTTGIGFLMLVSGVHKSLLEWRQRQRACPSCGRLIEGRVCRACTDD